MTNPGQNKVSVRVEVIVEGGQDTPVVSAYAEGPCGTTDFGFDRPHGWHHGLQIITPQPTGNTPVRQIGGVNCIESGGGSPVVSGHFASAVLAKAYPSPSVDPLSHSTPDVGAVSTSVSGGAWSFTFAGGNPVPGAACDATSGGPANSTIIVWYDFGGSPRLYVTESTPFHGYCPGGSGGSGPASGPSHSAHRRVRSGTLYATFTGALAGLGTVTLHWNGAAWVGTAARGEGSAVSFLGTDPGFHLLAFGPGVAFALSGPPASYHPFTWSATGTAQGAQAGPFEATVTE
jgi:hypothetical protein